MKSHDSSDHGDKRSALKEVRKDKSKSADMRSDKHKDKDAKHAEKKAERESKHAEKMKAKEEKRAEKMKEKEAKQAEKDKDKTTGTATTTGTTTTSGTATTANGGLLVDRGVVGPTSTGIKPVPGSPAPARRPVPLPSIRFIPSRARRRLSPWGPATASSGSPTGMATRSSFRITEEAWP